LQSQHGPDLPRQRESAPLLAQRHAGVDDYGWSWETSGVANCQAGTMVTLAVLYGGQQGSYHPGQAELATSLYGYESTLTVDTETSPQGFSCTQRTRPTRRTRHAEPQGEAWVARELKAEAPAVDRAICRLAQARLLNR
jgi:hypothetical protein